MRIDCFLLFTSLLFVFSLKIKAQYPVQQPADSVIIAHPYLHDLLPFPLELNGQYGLNVGDAFSDNFSLFSDERIHYTKNTIFEQAIINNKVVVLLAGNITCPGARMLIESFSNLNHETLSKALVIFINNSEAHPSSGPSPFAQVQGESLEIEANIPYFMFPQTKYYCDQYYRVDSLQKLFDLPDDWIYLLDGPECSFGIDFEGPFGMLVINPFTSLIEYEFPNINSGIYPDTTEFINEIDIVSETVGVINAKPDTKNFIAPNPLTADSKWIGYGKANDIILVNMYGEVEGRFTADDFSKINEYPAGIYVSYIYNKNGELITTQKVKIE